MDNVINLNNVTRLNVPVERVLSGALEDDLDEVIVLGFDKKGELYFYSSVADAGSVFYHLEMAKYKLTRICLDEEI